MRLLTWATSASAAGVCLGFIDVAAMTAIYPGVCSSLFGALQLWAQTSAVFVLFALPTTFLWAGVYESFAQRFVPRVSSWAAALLLATVATVATTTLAGLVDFGELEFPVEVRAALRVVEAVVAVFTLLLFSRLRRLIDRVMTPQLERGTRLGLLAISAFAAILCSHLIFAAIHELDAAVALGVAASQFMLLALIPSVRKLLPRAKAMAAGFVCVLCVLGVLLPGNARDHARYMLFSHGASSARFAQVLRDLVDIDGDGTASTWLGGTDCAEGNASVGPGVAEVPGDGIDQDCRGGDALESTALPRSALPQHCVFARDPLSVLLIVVDALRGDHFTPELMPGLTELGNASTVLVRAYSPTPLTVSSFPSLLSSLPLSDLVGANPLVEDQFMTEATLPERFKRQGYDTAVFSHLDYHPFSNRGFDSHNDYWRDESLPNIKFDLTSAAMCRGVLDYLEQRSARPSFVMLHLSDVHAPYPERLEREGIPDGFDGYALGVTYVDLHLQQLFARMQQHGLLQKTTVVVTSDHGEELSDRGRRGHGHNTYEEGTRVPLVIWSPNCRARRESRPVSTRQLGPTLGAMTGVDVPGRGLFSPTDLPVVVEGASSSTLHFKRVVMQGAYKLVVDVPNGGRVLFDLARDPEEQNNIYGKEPGAAAEMESAYQRWLDAPGRR